VFHIRDNSAILFYFTVVELAFPCKIFCGCFIYKPSIYARIEKQDFDVYWLIQKMPNKQVSEMTKFCRWTVL